MENKSKTKDYVLTALFAGLIFFVTAYALHIPTPATGGYIHLGDAFVYLAASILPMPLAVAAGGIGEALSDIMTGGAVYALPTFIIKSLMAMCFSPSGKTVISKRNTAAAAAAGLICAAGYYVTEALIYRSFISPAVEIPANLVQAGASMAIYLLIGKAFDKLNVKSKIARDYF
jgi:uncharacterized repeat protein (TIGR04002 family)